MDTFRNMRNDKLAKAMINKLAARNMEGFYVQTKEEAKELALSLIPEGSSGGGGRVHDRKSNRTFRCCYRGKLQRAEP